MSILDDAIREHLELKRAHGADDAELKKLEDEAFGPPGRPDDVDSLNEAPTEFLAAPGMDAGEAEADAKDPGARRAPNITDLQEPPQPSAPAEAAEPAAASEADTPAPEPAEEPAPEIDSGPTTEERHAIAEQPTEFFDVEADLGAAASPEQPSPTDEQLLDSQLAEPRLAPVDPPGEIDVTGPSAETLGAPLADEEEDDDFFSEQRLSDELNNALESPVTDEHEVFAPNEEPAPPTDEHAVAPRTDEHEAMPPSEEQPLAPATDEHEAGPYTDEHEALGTGEHDALDTDEHAAFPATDEHTAPPATDEHASFPATEEHEHEAEPPSEEATAIYNIEEHTKAEPEPRFDDPDEDAVRKPATEHEDVLEDTPDFLEDAPEDDDLWFEQKPPKDFDFDD